MGLMHPMFNNIGNNVKKRVRKVHAKPINRWEKYKPTEEELRAILKREREYATRSTEPENPNVRIIPMEDKDLSGWNTGKQTNVAEIPEGFCIAPAYNKGAYQVVPRTDTDAYRNRK